MFKSLDNLISLALEEDLGSGDLTTRTLISPQAQALGELEFKTAGVLAGLFAAEKVFRQLDNSLQFTALKKDGEFLGAGEIAAQIRGNAAAILTGERTALNFLQHLSGIATFTRKMVKQMGETKTRLLDTRKTTPGWRELEKYAVKTGGGRNHRIGLFDGILIKNNHLKFCPSITWAIAEVRGKYGKNYSIEVEVENFSQLQEALTAGADIILLDNMTPEQIKQAVSITQGRAKLEISGGISPENIAGFAGLGADYISCGALTHSAPALDIHLKITTGES